MSNNRSLKNNNLYENSVIEKLTKIKDHTPKDLAGWHACLDVIHALLDGRSTDFRQKEWKKW